MHTAVPVQALVQRLLPHCRPVGKNWGFLKRVSPSGQQHMLHVKEKLGQSCGNAVYITCSPPSLCCRWPPAPTIEPLSV